MIYRAIFGLTLSIIYLLIFTQTVDWFPAFHRTLHETFTFKGGLLLSAKTGFIFIYLMAIASVFFITVSQEMHKIFIGVFLSVITLLVLYSFY